MSSYLVTGGGRGLGLALVDELSKKSDGEVSIVFAATRSAPSDALQKLIDNSNGKVAHVQMVITEKASVAAAAEQVEKRLAGNGLDVLINNAGIMPVAFDGVASMNNLGEALQVNVEAVHYTTAAFLPLLHKGQLKKIANISSTVGSVAMTRQYSFAPTPAYKISKTALNMLSMQYALELEKDGFTVLMISPGYLKTDMTAHGGDLPVEVGAKATLDIVFKSINDKNGKFFNIHVPGWENAEGPNKYDGHEVPC